MKSRNILKSFLTVFLGYFLVDSIVQLMTGNYVLGILMLFYLIGIEFIIAKILDAKGKLEPLINEYENGIYKEQNHTQQKI